MKKKIEIINQKIIKENNIFGEIVSIIETSKKQVAVQINSGIVLQFWHIETIINKHILENKRADYGKQIVSTVSTQLTGKYGKVYELRNLQRMLQFATNFQDFENVVPLARHLSWSHI